MADNGVFISYRRGTGSDVARIMQEFLEGQGFDVFLDVDSLTAGHFDEQLLREIESRRSFVMICSPGSFDRCTNEADWVRREIAHALRTGRHIVPVTLPHFVWPSGESLPPDIAAIRRHNAFDYSHSHWGATKPKLVTMLGSRPQARVRGPVRLVSRARFPGRIGIWIGIAALAAVAVLLLGRLWMKPQPGAADVSQLKGAEQARAAAAADSPASAIGSADSRSPFSRWDVEILREEPDPSVVLDAEGRARMKATGLPWKLRDRKTGIVMLLCPPGEFMMGSPPDEAGRESDESQRLVSIERPFYIGETEVTVDLWTRWMKSGTDASVGAEDGSIPIEGVSWEECRRFCLENGLRLPSEAEWEYACRAGRTGAYAGDFDSMAWYRSSGRERPSPVGKLLPNEWGLFDMHGNIWEWCEDSYAETAIGTQSAANGLGDRVLRGGCYLDQAADCRAAVRWRADPSLLEAAEESIDYPTGFRVARTAE